MAYAVEKRNHGMQSWIGWGLTTLALFFLNRRSKDSSSTDIQQDPSTLNATGTKLGTPIPVVMGQCLIKAPLTSYWGDFDWRLYTEEYGAHSELDIGSAIASFLLSLIATLLMPDDVTVVPGQKVDTPAGPGATTSPGSGKTVNAGTKRAAIIYAIINFLLWLLIACLTNHELKTTIQKGFKYYLGWQQVLCWAHPNARLKRIYMNEKEVWSGDEPASNHTDGSPFIININDENLFGGPDEDGGFVGSIRVYFGGANQGADSWMKAQMNASSVQADLRGQTPAYRPFISVVVPKAYIGKRSVLPTMWYEIQIIPTNLNATQAQIGLDANPAEVLYEIVVNNMWGLAESNTTLNLDALREAGATLYSEKIGISTLITSRTEARSFVDNVCNHINAVRYSDQASGTVVYKLIRGDYDDTNLVEVNESNCSEITFTRQDWTNTISEVSVSFTDRESIYETGTLTVDDPANIEIQNGVKTNKEFDYSFFTTAANALWAARREGNALGYPLATFSLTCNRKLAETRLGDVLLLNFAPYGIINMRIRVTSINLGDLQNGVVQIEAMEDVFSLAKTDYTYSSSTEWEKTQVLPSKIATFMFFEMPYELLRTDAYTYVYGFACQPSKDTATWTIWRKEAGTTVYNPTTSMMEWTAAGRLVYDYDEFGEVYDTEGFQITELYGMEALKFDLDTGSTASIVSARQGDKLLIMGDEMMAYSGLEQLPNGNWLVTGIIRGVFDTVPHEHSALDVCYFLQTGHYGNVTTGGPVCMKGNTVTEKYAITTASVNKSEPLDETTAVELTTKRRSERPTVQGVIRMYDHNHSEKYHLSTVAGDLAFTWKPRDRYYAKGCVTQDDIADFYTGQDYETPNGEEYIVDVLVNDDLVRQETFSGSDVVSGGRFEYTWAQRCDDAPNMEVTTTINLYCRRDGLESYQKQSRTFTWTIPQLMHICATEADAAQWLMDNENADHDGVVVQLTPFTNVQYIKYDDAPVILLGEKVPVYEAGAILAADGEYWKPNGKYLTAHSTKEYDVKDLETGYSFMTTFHTVQDMPTRYYRWQTNAFIEVNKDGGA